MDKDIKGKRPTILVVNEAVPQGELASSVWRTNPLRALQSWARDKCTPRRFTGKDADGRPTHFRMPSGMVIRRETKERWERDAKR